MRRLALALLVAVTLASAAAAGPPVGYYRQPTIHDRTVVFVAEGDLWKVPATGGVATRLTSHPGDEGWPAISPDGRRLAFVAHYEGPTEVYTMQLGGGLPTRRTWGIEAAAVFGWTDDATVLVTTPRYSGLPSWQLVQLDVSRDDVSARQTRVPLAQAADGCYDEAGTLFFTRLPFQGSHTKRYKGGTAQNIWRFAADDGEARPLTADYAGTSKRPMCWRGRIYFASDRDGTMNLWSMDGSGGDLRQHTRHSGWDVKGPSLQAGRIVYQLGADLHLYDVSRSEDRALEITLDTDLDQTRENWVAKPMDYLTSAHVSPDGDRAVLTARGRVFVAPHRQGRLVEAARRDGVRYRDARFMPDGKTLLALSDESGEVELWQLPADGVGPAEQLTDDGDVLRWQALPSPDGRYVAHHDKNQRLFLLDLERKRNRQIEASRLGGFFGLAWSPDGKWLAYVVADENMFSRVKLYDVDSGEAIFATSDRYDSYSPAWSPDGKWLYLLSDRNLRSLVGSPWGSYQPEPYLDRKTEIYQVALTDGLRSPFAPADELHPEGGDDKSDAPDEAQPTTDESAGDDEALPDVDVTVDGIQGRLIRVPVPAGNYANLMVTDEALFWLSRPTGENVSHLVAAPIARDEVEVEPVVEKAGGVELSHDRKKILLRQGERLLVIDAKAGKADLDKKDVELSAWKLSVQPREEWRQMFDEAWRLERDYFYDRGMHGIDWKAMRDKYRPLVDRVTSRGELSDLLAQMVSELSALHIFVRGGDTRDGEDDVRPAHLGAVLERDDDGGYRVVRLHASDPDEPERRSPLAHPEVGVGAGDVIEMVDGVPTAGAPDIGALLRGRAGRQVRLRVRPGSGGDSRDVIVEPLSDDEARDLRYHEWEYTRRLEVERLGQGSVGYVHLRAMGGRNFTEWARGYYPVFARDGLIVDVRHNRGGNIDSWILGRLLRKAWFHWSQRVGDSPSWNMQYAFRGHVVVLCDERTASDGEAFTEGIRRLGIGKIIGTRTWGGEIWLTGSNFLVDRGVATAAEFGVYGPEGEWLIEGHGVEPDIVVDNLPHATFEGRDAQLEAAVDYLKKKIAEEPVERPGPPPGPDKSFR